MDKDTERIEGVKSLITQFGKDKEFTDEEVNLCLKIWKNFAKKRRDVYRSNGEVWAAGVLHAFAIINFVENISQGTLSTHFKVSHSNLNEKSLDIRRTLKIRQFDDRYCTEHAKRNNPFNEVAFTKEGYFVPKSWIR